MKTRIIIRNEALRDRAHRFIDSLCLERPMVMEVFPLPNRRSLNQNALYWRWIDVLGGELGYDKEDMHEVLMRKLLTPNIVVDLDGVEHEKYSTKRLTKEQMTEYMDGVTRVAAEMGISLPHPEDAQRR